MTSGATSLPLKDASDYLLLLLSQAIPHRGNNLGNFPEGSIGVLTFNRGLGVSEKQGIGRHWLLRLIWIFLFLFLWSLGLLCWIYGCWSLLPNHLR